MRLFPTDWIGFLDELAGWGELSIAARRSFLDGIAPGLSLELSGAGPAIVELREAGLLVPSGSPGYLGVAERSTQFHQVMKALEKCPLFESSGLAALCSYIADHYSQQERSRLHESLALLPNDIPRIAGFVSSVEWLRLALERQGRTTETAELETARVMLAFFSEQRDRVPIRDLEEYFPGASREDLCAGMRIGVQRAVFFLGLRRADLEPLVGIWPAAARRLRRLAVLLAPEPVAVVQHFHHPFLVEDMTTLLAVARLQPIPLRRGDERPFARFVEETAAMLLSLPEWLETLTGLSPEGRISLAIQALRSSGLLAPGGSDRGGAAPLAPAPQAAAWIKRPFLERRDSVARAFAGAPGSPSRMFDLMEDEWASVDGARQELLPWLVQAFSSVPAATFIRFADFAEYQAGLGSPLGEGSIAAAAAWSRVGETFAAGSGLATEEAMEELWKSFLAIFLGRCLLSLGGAEAGVSQDGKGSFRLTDAGRGLLGLPRDGREDADERGAAAAELIVQPNFEIVFLSPCPRAEAVLGRFCERIGRGVGVLFRITRRSIQRAAAAGLDAAELLGVLSGGSGKPVPPNVEHEINEWSAPA